jgi:hypothetical protein
MTYACRSDVTVHSPGTGSFSRVSFRDFRRSFGHQYGKNRENVPVPLPWAVNCYRSDLDRRESDSHE